MTTPRALLQKIIPDSSPDRFKFIYLLLALFCLVIILAVSLYVVRGLSNNHLVYDVEMSSERIADALFYTEVESISIEEGERGGDPFLSIPRTAFTNLDVRIRDMLDPLEIVRIIVYDSKKRVVYSTDKQMVGDIEASNSHLNAALNGKKQSVVRIERSIVDLVGEKRLNLYLAEVYVPVLHKNGRVAGVFVVYSDISKQKIEFSHQLVTSAFILAGAILVISLMSYVVIIMASKELKKAYRLLETYATTDSLTETCNRRELMERADDHFALMQRSREKLAHGIGLGLVMVDIDHFKNVNDNYGHLVGDIVLREVARRIGGVLRPYDVLGRYGGEEFLILLPNTGAGEVGTIAGRVLDAVREIPFQAGEISISMTTSVGATWTDALKESLDNAISRSDTLLYEAKHLGRNQLVFRI